MSVDTNSIFDLSAMDGIVLAYKTQCPNHILPQGNEVTEKKTSKFSSGTRPDNEQTGVNGKWVYFVISIDILECLTVFVSCHIDGQCYFTFLRRVCLFLVSRPLVFRRLFLLFSILLSRSRTKGRNKLTDFTWRYLFIFC